MVTNSTSVAGFKNKADERFFLTWLFEVTLVKSPQPHRATRDYISPTYTKSYKESIIFKMIKSQLKAKRISLGPGWGYGVSIHWLILKT